MNDLMFRLNRQIGGWLNNRLPKITKDWWQELVVHNLTSLQQKNVHRNDIHELSGLDLAALLRILDCNWFAITSSFFINSRERGNIRAMQEIRNTRAHITPNDITKQRVIEDLNVIISRMQAFDVSTSMRDIRNAEQRLSFTQAETEVGEEKNNEIKNI